MTADTAGERLVVLQGQRLLRQKEKFIIFIAFGQFLLKFFVYFYIGLYEKTRFLFCDGDDAASQGADQPPSLCRNEVRVVAICFRIGFQAEFFGV